MYFVIQGDLRKLAHLEEQLGDGRFAVLIDSANTGKVKDFCDELIRGARPIAMTVGGCTYDLLRFLRGDEESVRGSVMVDRAKEMKANLGKEDGTHILEHHDEIPVALRGKVIFVFTDWRHPDDIERVACVCWNGVHWVLYWYRLGSNDWNGLARVPRRK